MNIHILSWISKLAGTKVRRGATYPTYLHIYFISTYLLNIYILLYCHEPSFIQHLNIYNVKQIIFQSDKQRKQINLWAIKKIIHMKKMQGILKNCTYICSFYFAFSMLLCRTEMFCCLLKLFPHSGRQKPRCQDHTSSAVIN